MQRLLYISQSGVEGVQAQSMVANIVAYTKSASARLGVTGALIFTGQHFAQILEGPPTAVEDLMEHIGAEHRQGTLVVIFKTPITDRLFPDWQLAYQGQSQFVTRKLETLLHATSTTEKQRAAHWITELALEFSMTRSHFVSP